MRIGKDISQEIPLIIISLVIVAIAFIPLRIVAYGFLPSDDALRHSAKVVSGKSWGEILVLRDSKMPDNHPGWHAILGMIYRITGCDVDKLVMFSIIFLFLLFSIPPAFFFRRPEAWISALLVLSLTNFALVWRLLTGRPYIVSMFAVTMICLLWPNLKKSKPRLGVYAFLVFVISMAVCIHGSWYLFMLPIAAFFFAREWRAGLRLSAIVVCGIFIGALVTGQPYPFLRQNLLHGVLAFGTNTLTRMLVGEFQPFNGDVLTVAAVFGMLCLRHLSGRWLREVVDNPVFILVAISWILGFVANRFWLDWGMPALSIWMAGEFQESFTGIKYFSWKRVLLIIVIAAVFCLVMTNDADSRWTWNLTIEYLDANDPKQAEWLPEPGGIIYSNDMGVFYETFFKNPRAPWRYILGFESALMPEEDLQIYRKIQWNFNAFQSFEPWVKKMRPCDRLILKRSADSAPKIPDLEWHYAASFIWIGRPPKDGKKAQ